jgi:hypothetical protein
MTIRNCDILNCQKMVCRTCITVVKCKIDKTSRILCRRIIMGDIIPMLLMFFSGSGPPLHEATEGRRAYPRHKAMDIRRVLGTCRGARLNASTRRTLCVPIPMKIDGLPTEVLTKVGSYVFVRFIHVNSQSFVSRIG